MIAAGVVLTQELAGPPTKSGLLLCDAVFGSGWPSADFDDHLDVDGNVERQLGHLNGQAGVVADPSAIRDRPPPVSMVKPTQR